MSMSVNPDSAFTAHNVRLNDGSCTMPGASVLTADHPWLLAALRVLKVLYRGGYAAKAIVDLGCLEGGYTAEFARLGFEATGIEVRQSNINNCEIVRAGLGLPNLRFHKSDVWDLKRYGVFDAIFCCGLLYHLDRPAEFIKVMGDCARDVIIINTHYALEEECANFALSPMTENESLRGRWYGEHDISDTTELEKYKWTSWLNKRSFWLTKASIFQALHDAGFDLLFEQVDLLSPNIRETIENRYFEENCRSMFVGIRTR